MKTLVLALLAIGCGGGGGSPHNDAPGDTVVRKDAAVDAKIFLDSGAPALTIKNFDAWCAVTVNGGAAMTGTITVPITGAATLTLTATPNPADGSTFELGPAHTWFKTDGDTGSGDPGMTVGNVNTAMVTVSSMSKCVYACCPFSPGGNGCEVGNAVGDVPPNYCP